MPRAGAVAFCGIGLLLAGLVLFVYATVFEGPYAGASGAGMAGLPSAMRVLAALAMLAVGGLTALVAGLAYFLRRRR